MRIALITSCKVLNIEKYIPSGCTAILTNDQSLLDMITSVPVTYEPNSDELIKNADYVTVLCSRKNKKRPSILARCKRCAKSFEFVFID